MPKFLKSAIGLILLLTTVSLVTCQSLIEVSPFRTDPTVETK